MAFQAKINVEVYSVTGTARRCDALDLAFGSGLWGNGTMDIESRVAPLEQDVGNLKNLAALEKELSALKGKSTSEKPARRGGLRIFMYSILGLVIGLLIVGLLLLPIIADMVSALFEPLSTTLESM